MLQIPNRDALVRTSLIDTLKEGGLEVLETQFVIRYKENALSTAPKPTRFGKLRYGFRHALEEAWEGIFDERLWHKRRVYVLSKARWERQFVSMDASLLWYPRQVHYAAQDAMRIVPTGKLFADVLIQDKRVIDPILGMECGYEVAYLKIWEGDRIIA